jgi:hypothetical protein
MHPGPDAMHAEPIAASLAIPMRNTGYGLQVGFKADLKQIYQKD